MVSLTYYSYSAFGSSFFTILFFFLLLIVFLFRKTLECIFERKKNYLNDRGKSIKQKIIMRLKSFRFWLALFLDFVFIFEGIFLVLLVFFINTFLLAALFLGIYGFHISMGLITLLTVTITYVHTCRERNYKHTLLVKEVGVHDLLSKHGNFNF
jgi:cbb3-type cytochrome oxidase subunit 3